jgi:hypothetical protein
VTPEEPSEEKLVAAAYALLKGIPSRDSNGLPRQKYLEADSREEKEARRAMAILLASDKPLDGLVRRLLAGLFDPEFEYSIRPKEEKNKAVERRIVFTQPGRRAVEHNRRLRIGFELWCAMGEPKKGEKPKRGVQAKAIEKLQLAYPSLDEKTIRDAYEYAKKTRWVP